MDAQGKGAGETASHAGLGGAELVGPTDGQCVVTPYGDMDMAECNNMLKN
jgi:hypothetical protein